MPLTTQRLNEKRHRKALHRRRLLRRRLSATGSVFSPSTIEASRRSFFSKLT